MDVIEVNKKMFDNIFFFCNSILRCGSDMEIFFMIKEMKECLLIL